MTTGIREERGNAMGVYPPSTTSLTEILVRNRSGIPQTSELLGGNEAKVRVVRFESYHVLVCVCLSVDVTTGHSITGAKQNADRQANATRRQISRLLALATPNIEMVISFHTFSASLWLVHV
jgi:hypothetical protein